MKKWIVFTIVVTGLLLIQSLQAGRGYGVKSCELGGFSCMAGTQQINGGGNSNYKQGSPGEECGTFFFVIACGDMAVPDERE